MNALASAARELLGLFVEDAGFALMIVAVVSVATLAALLLHVALAAGGILIVGCLAVLGVDLIRAATKRR